MTEKAIYKITQEGQIVAKWNEGEQGVRPKLDRGDSSTTSTLDPRPSQASEREDRTSVSICRPRPELDDSLVTDKDPHAKDSHTARMRQILDEPALRSLFREFLRANFCEENLSFWLDVQDFKRRFNTTSSAAASPSKDAAGATGQRVGGHQAMEKHQQDLIAMAFVIYNSASA